MLAGQAPALLASFDLSEGRASALVRAAREVASGRVDLDDPDHERGWRRLRAIRGIGRWTVQMLALTGQGRLDQLPAADVGFLKLVGKLSHRQTRAPEPPRRRSSSASRPYAPWAGLAGLYALHAHGKKLTPRAVASR